MAAQDIMENAMVAGNMVALQVRPRGLPAWFRHDLWLMAGMVLENDVNKLVLAVSPAAKCATRVDMELRLTDGVRFAVAVRSFTDVSHMVPESYMNLEFPLATLNPARLSEMREAYAKACKEDHGKPYFDTRAGDVFRRNRDAEGAPLRLLHSAVVDFVSPVVAFCVEYTSRTREFITEGVLQYMTEPRNELEREGDDEDAWSGGESPSRPSRPWCPVTEDMHAYRMRR